MDTNQDEILMDVYSREASTVQYQCIETLLGDTGSKGFPCVLSAVFLRLCGILIIMTFLSQVT